MLANIRCDDGIAFTDLVELLQNPLRFNDLAIALITQAIALAPIGNLSPPTIQAFLAWPLMRLLQKLTKHGQYFLGITDDRQVNLDVL
jgi:hypothetical protein